MKVRHRVCYCGWCIGRRDGKHDGCHNRNHADSFMERPVIAASEATAERVELTHHQENALAAVAVQVGDVFATKAPPGERARDFALFKCVTGLSEAGEGVVDDAGVRLGEGEQHLVAHPLAFQRRGQTQNHEVFSLAGVDMRLFVRAREVYIGGVKLVPAGVDGLLLDLDERERVLASFF